MATRCKFVCNSVEKSKNHDGRFLYNAKFRAVYDGSPENKEFFAYTPSGTLDLQMYRDDVFEVGKEYYLDISLAVPVPVAA